MAERIAEDEIIDFYKSNDIAIMRKEDLQRPSKEFVLELYIRILNSLNIYNVNQPDVLACINSLNENMEKTYLMMNVIKAIKRLASNAGLNDVKISDILEPKRNRTIRILHALINYYVRYNTLKSDWLLYAEKFSNLHLKRKELEKKQIEYKHSIEDKSLLLSSLKNKSAAIEKEMEQLEEIFSVKKTEAENAEKKAVEIKTEISNLKQKLCDVEFEIEQSFELNKKLAEKVMKSPNKIISAIDDSENKLKLLKEEYQMLKTEYNEFLTKRSSYSLSETFINIIKEIKELIELQVSNDDIYKELDEKIKSTANLNEEIVEIEMKNRETEECIQSLKASINKDDFEHNRKKTIHIKILDGLNEKFNENDKNLKKIKNDLEKKLNCLKQLKNEYDELCINEKRLQQQIMDEHRSIMEKYFTILKKFRKFPDNHSLN